MFDDDICRCMSENCSYYNECYRGKGHNYRPGIYTYSLLGEGCNKENNYKYFMEGDKKCED